uniref:Uncharacterized protein n=1 Tax=Amphimedon queenslandica TaxID=400682 RepID=A0A1X7TBV7_AMPQE
SHSPVFGFLKFAPNNRLALNISFGSRTGHYLILARAFYQVFPSSDSTVFDVPSTGHVMLVFCLPHGIPLQWLGIKVAVFQALKLYEVDYWKGFLFFYVI